MFISSLTRGSLLSLAAAALPLLLASAACSGAAGTEGTAEETAGAVTSVPIKATSAAVPCEGALPDVCELCADGKEECAHWVREDGKCEVQICPPATATPPITVTSPPSTAPGHPICDPDGRSPGEGCHWDEIACKWLCATTASTGTATGPSTGSSTGTATSQIVIHGGGGSATAACTGPLPDLCELCTDGSDGCAHWVVEDGKCEIQYCTPHPVCDPPGRAPNKDCRWDELVCEWICL